ARHPLPPRPAAVRARARGRPGRRGARRAVPAPLREPARHPGAPPRRGRGRPAPARPPRPSRGREPRRRARRAAFRPRPVRSTFRPVKVVFHADDFGLTRAVNSGIVEAFDKGVLRSTSLMPGAGAAEDAAALARALPRLDVGLHLTLVEERPILPPDRIPSLVSDGRFWPSHVTVFARWATGRWRVDEAAAEAAAQWERIRELGVRPSHCDGHQHLHLLPGLFPRVVALARGDGVRFVRTRLVGAPGGSGAAVRRATRVVLNAVAALARRG